MRIKKVHQGKRKSNLYEIKHQKLMNHLQLVHFT